MVELKKNRLYRFEEIESGYVDDKIKNIAISLDRYLSTILDEIEEFNNRISALCKRNDNLTSYQEDEIHPYVKSLLQFKTIENLYTPDIRVVSKIPHGCVDMRKVMSKPFCIENLYYAKHEPVDEATLDEFNQNTGNNVKKAEVYLSRKALNEVHEPQIQVVTSKGI